MIFVGAWRRPAYLGLVLGSLAIAGCAAITHSLEVKGEGHGHGGHHGHGVLEIPQGQPVPEFTLTVEPDTVRGWNLHLEVSNFEFAPERVNQASVVTEGHAHLFVNGEKITRLYGPWYYLSSLPAGEHELRVELNGNGHETLAVNGQPIEATVIVEVPTP